MYILYIHTFYLMSDWCQVLGEKRRVREPREGVHSQVQCMDTTENNRRSI